MASEGGSPNFAPGVTTTGFGRVASCTRHFCPGISGVSVYPVTAVFGFCAKANAPSARKVAKNFFMIR